MTVAHFGTPSGPVVKRANGPVVYWSSCPWVQWISGPVVQWSNGPVVQWSSGPVVRLFSGSVVQLSKCSSGPMAQWSRSPVVQAPTAPLWESKSGDSCTQWKTQGQINNLQQRPSGSKSGDSCTFCQGQINNPQQHRSGRAKVVTVAHFGGPKARSTASNSIPLGEPKWWRLHIMEDPRPDQQPPTAPLWDSKSGDSCTLWRTQGQINNLQQHRSGRAKVVTVAHFGRLKARSTTSNSTRLGTQKW